MSGRLTKPVLVVVFSALALVSVAVAGSLTPSGPVAATMHSLANIYDSIASATFDSSGIVANQNGSLLANLKYIENQMAWASGSNNIWNLNSGNVGIASSSPAYTLTVGGNARVRSSLSIGDIPNSFGIWWGDPGTDVGLGVEKTFAGPVASTSVGIVSFHLANNGAGHVGLYNYAQYNAAIIQPTDSSSYYQNGGLVVRANHTGSGVVSDNSALEADAFLDGGGTVNYNYGAYITSTNFGTGTINNGYGVYTYSGAYSGNVVNDYGIMIDSPWSSGVITNHYGLYINPQNYGTNNWAMYQSSSADKNYFAGNVGIGTGNPQTKLTVSNIAGASAILASASTNASLNTNSANGSTGTYMTSYRTNANTHTEVLGFAARGTRTSPLALSSGDDILYLGGLGYTGAAFTADTVAVITFEAAGNFNATSAPTNMMFSTTASGSVSPSERMRIDPNGNVGINKTAPTTKLDVSGSASVSGTFEAGILKGGNFIVTNSGSGSQFRAESYRNSSLTHALFIGAAARGTEASPIALNSGDDVMYLYGEGYTGSGFSPVARINFQAAGNLNASSSPGRIIFETVASGSTSFTERMRIDQTGNVGIGTAAPGALLTVSGAASVSGNFGIRSGATVALYANTSTGNVGIGTLSTTYKLVVAGAIGGNNAFSEPAGAGVTPATGDKLVSFESATYRSAIGFSSTGLYIQNTKSGAGNDGIRFFTGNQGVASESMRITSAGVGIGTTAPGINGGLLEVKGATTAINRGAGNPAQLFVGDKATTQALDAGGRIDFGGFQSALGDIYSWGGIKGAAQNTSGYGGYLALFTEATSSTLTERMRIDQAGNVGIGTTAPGALLTVSGTASVSGNFGINTNKFFVNATSGNVGIGTKNLTTDTFELLGTASVSGQIRARGGITSPGTGTNSEQFGNNANASGNGGLAVGNGAIAATLNSMAVGNSAVAQTGTGAMAIGFGASATGASGIAIGGANSAGNSAIAIGSQATAPSLQDIIIGLSASGSAGGISQIAIGANTFVRGSRVVAVGNSVQTRASDVIAIGSGVHADANQIVIGNTTTPTTNLFFNFSSSSAPGAFTINGTGGAGTDVVGANLTIAGGRGTGAARGGSLIFQTANGTTTGSGLNTLATRMTIVASGSIGIGTTGPVHLVHIASSGDGNILRLQDTSGTCDHNPEAGSETVTCSSDISLKTNIVDAPSVLPYFADFRIRSYTIIASGKPMTGVIAQELRLTHPELIATGSDGLLMVQEPNPWLLVKGLQELTASSLLLDQLLTTETISTEPSGPLARLVHNVLAFIEQVFHVRIGDGEVKADRLCAGDTCVNSEQLLRILEKSDISPNTPAPTPTPTTSDTPSTTATPDSATPTPEITQLPSETAAPTPSDTPEPTPTPTENPTPEANVTP